MERGAQRRSPLRERIRELEYQLEYLDREVRELSRAVETPTRRDAARRLRLLDAQQSLGSLAPGAGAAAQSPPQDVQQQRELFPVENAGPARTAVPVRDEQFANYFVAGSLEGVRPLRQERRIQRNKAIVMLVLALILLYGVIRLLL